MINQENIVLIQQRQIVQSRHKLMFLVQNLMGIVKIVQNQTMYMSLWIKTETCLKLELVDKH